MMLLACDDKSEHQLLRSLPAVLFFISLFFRSEIKPDKDADESKHPEVKKCVDQVF
jgi:hypothetical protein